MGTKAGRRRTVEKTRGNTLEWLSGQNLADFRGLWIVAHNRRILAKAPTLDKALAEAKLEPGIVPFVWKIPEAEKLVL